MSHRFGHIATVATITTALLGSAAVAAAAAQASMPAPTAFTQTEPPGPCNPDEIGQSKVGPDGQTYTCLPVSRLSQT